MESPIDEVDSDHSLIDGVDRVDDDDADEDDQKKCTASAYH